MKEQWPLESIRTHVWALVFRRHDQYNLVLEHGAAVDDSGSELVGESKAGAPPAAEEKTGGHPMALQAAARGQRGEGGDPRRRGLEHRGPAGP